jgi:flagellar basal-body rod protein FlgG
MFRALRTAALGMSAQQLSVDNIANNLANVNTQGYKRTQIAFQDLFYQTLAASRMGASANNVSNDSPELQVGHGSRPVATIRNFSQGSMEESGNPLDLAINGIGFFQISRPDGSIAYSRDGGFTLNSQGMLVNSSGLPLADQIEIPQDAVSIKITQDGNVSAMIQGQNALGDNLFEATDSSGDPFLGMPGAEGFGGVMQGFTENSNVDIVNEMVRLIVAQRAYETNSKMVTTAEEMMGITNSIKR